MRTNPSIVMINETNPKNFKYTALKSEFHISGYTMLTSGFYEKGKRGIIAYIDNNLSGTEIVIKSKFQEYICFKITRDKLSTNFLLIYRCPNSIGENNDQLIILLEGFMKLKGQKIIVGDFNLPQINWITFNSIQFNSFYLDNKYKMITLKKNDNEIQTSPKGKNPKGLLSR